MRRGSLDGSISQDAQVIALERAAASFDVWKPSVDGSVAAVRLEVGKPSKHWERSVLERPPPIFEKSPSAAGRPSAAGGAESPDGHRVVHTVRESGFGSVRVVVHSPVTGTSTFLDLVHPSMNTQFHRYSCHLGYGSEAELNSGRLPKLNFPSLDGDNPKLCLTRSADFLEFYSVPPSMCVKMASMHIVLPAARWLPGT